MTQDVRLAWRQGWLNSLQEIADLDIQKRTWLNPDNANPHYSYVEYVASYFDDLGLALGDSYSDRIGEGLLSAAEAAGVAEFHTRFDAYVDGGCRDPEAVLADPKWLEVVEAARSAQACLLLLLDNEEEKVMLTRRSPHAVSASS